MISKMMICCFSLALFVAVLPGTALAQAAEDNANVTGLINRAKTELVKIKKDAADMEAFTRSDLSWRTHADKLTRMKADVNELSSSVEGMKSQRRVASAWQQNAIDRISPLMSDLVMNMNTVIDQLGKSKNRPNAAPYPEYLKTNTRIATDLSNEIIDALDYAQAKGTMDRLSERFDKS